MEQRGGVLPHLAMALVNAGEPGRRIDVEMDESRATDPSSLRGGQELVVFLLAA